MAGEPGFRCLRGPRCQADYVARLSGPLLDRIDLKVEVPAMKAAELLNPRKAESSATVAARVAQARDAQRQRYEGLGLKVVLNAHCPPSHIQDIAAPDAAGTALLNEASDKLSLSARGYHRVLKVARTLADLDGAADVGRIHLAEAISYRMAGERLAQAA